MRAAALALLAACGSSSHPAAPTTPAPTNSAPAAAQPAPLALVVVLEGQEIFIGNDETEPADSPARYTGHLHDIASVMPELAKLPGQAALVTYASGTKVVHPLGPLSAVDATWPGSQKAYYGKLGLDLVAGLGEAARILQSAPAGSRRVVAVIGDSCDTDMEVAHKQLPGVLAQLEGVELIDVRLLSEISVPECDLLARHSRRVELGQLAAAIGAPEHTP